MADKSKSTKPSDYDDNTTGVPMSDRKTDIEPFITHYGEKPTEETKTRILDYIEAHKEEIIREERLKEQQEFEQSPSSQSDDTSSSGGELAEDY
jgi:hypothetical protein